MYLLYRMFQHTAARRRLFCYWNSRPRLVWFQHTAARRRLHEHIQTEIHRTGFNTQPPEGGCKSAEVHTKIRTFQHTAARRRLDFGGSSVGSLGGFNTQPPEGGCRLKTVQQQSIQVSTHSRPKAAARKTACHLIHTRFQHTAARRRLN